MPMNSLEQEGGISLTFYVSVPSRRRRAKPVSGGVFGVRLSGVLYDFGVGANRRGASAQARQSGRIVLECHSLRASATNHLTKIGGLGQI